MLLDEVLVGKFISIDGFAPGAVASSEVAALTHEAGNNAMEGRPLITEAFLAGTKGAEVIASFRAYVGV